MLRFATKDEAERAWRDLPPEQRAVVDVREIPEPSDAKATMRS